MVCQQHPFIPLTAITTILSITVIDYFYNLPHKVPNGQPDDSVINLESVVTLLDVDLITTICIGGVASVIFWMIASQD